MKFFQLFIFIVALSQVESFLPFSLTQLNFLKSEQQQYSKKTETPEAIARTTTISTTTTSTTTTSTTTTSTTTTSTTTTSTTTTATTTEEIESVFEKNVWLDNILQLIIERIIRLAKLLFQKFIMKQDISLADFLMNVLVA